MILEFKSSLLREKFILRDALGDDLSDSAPVIALSNRMALMLSNENGEQPETFIVRTQNMHSCVRLCAAISKEYSERGAITGRVMPFRWDNLWGDVIKGYEKDWNPNIWCAIYFKGRPIFEYGEHHPFLDIIEKCDAASGQSYDDSVKFAEQAFGQAGKAVTIEHQANVALIVSITQEEAKCGVILRVADRKTTFNYNVKRKKNGIDNVRIPTILTASAAFLEGVQLAFTVGMTNKKRSIGMIETYSDEDRKGKRGVERLVNLGNAIESLEKKYIVHYRPDRPDFQAMVRDAESFAMTILKPIMEAKIASGELNTKDWVL